MEPIVLDDELLARIARIGGTRVSRRCSRGYARAVRGRSRAGARRQDYAGIAARLRCSESVVRQRVSRGLAMLRRIYEEEARDRVPGPAGRRSVRTGRAARVAGAAPSAPPCPRSRSCVGAIAIVSLPGGSEERERVARPPAGVLERNYAAFRRPRTAADVLPGAAASRSRLIARDGDVRLFAVPSADSRTMCLKLVPGGTACAPLDPGEPQIYSDDEVYAALVPDRVRDVRVLGEADARRAGESGILVARAVGGLSWTDAKGTRYVLRVSPAPPATRLLGCPSALDPLPDDALERGMRAALIAVDRLYPKATSARVAGAGEGAGDLAPCPAPIGERSMIIGLRLTPRGAGGSPTPPQGRLLVGLVDGRAIVYDKLD